MTLSITKPDFLFSRFRSLNLILNWLFLIKDDVLTVEILEQSEDNASRQSNQFNSIEKTEENSTPQIMKRPPVPTFNATAASANASSDEDEEVNDEKQQVGSKQKQSITLNNTKFRGSKGALPSPLGSAQSFDLHVANWRMEKLEVDSKSGSEEEFYDCLGEKFEVNVGIFFSNFSFFLCFNFYSGCMWVDKFSCKLARYLLTTSRGIIES